MGSIAGNLDSYASSTWMFKSSRNSRLSCNSARESDSAADPAVGNKAPSYRVSSVLRASTTGKETIIKEWLKPAITESEAGMEVTSYLPAELDRT